MNIPDEFTATIRSAIGCVVMEDCERCEDRPADCYCGEDEGAGYTYDDEYGPCDWCLGQCSWCDKDLIEEEATKS